MRIIPVIDIMGGVTIHAKGGRRDDYQPIRSQLCETSNPIDLALALKSDFGFRELYIAVLYSIMGLGNNTDMIKELIVLDLSRVGSESGVNTDSIRKVLGSVDIPVITGGGVRNIDDVLLLRDLGVSGILISTALHDLKIRREDLLKL